MTLLCSTTWYFKKISAILVIIQSPYACGIIIPHERYSREFGSDKLDRLLYNFPSFIAVRPLGISSTENSLESRSDPAVQRAECLIPTFFDLDHHAYGQTGRHYLRDYLHFSTVIMKESFLAIAILAAWAPDNNERASVALVLIHAPGSVGEQDSQPSGEVERRSLQPQNLKRKPRRYQPLSELRDLGISGLSVIDHGVTRELQRATIHQAPHR
nr:hypothetical protein Iba_chr14fCG2620 [Ipomoea batatas]